MKYSIEELMPFYIGRGAERICFKSPEDPESVIKISPVSNAKQTVREIDYFQYLEKKKVPFTHIPKFKGLVELDGYIGFEQEAVLDKGGNHAFSLGDYMKSKGDFCLRSFHYEKKKTLFQDFFDYLCRFNIIFCDLSLSNILIDERNDRPKLVLIDGLGCTDFLPVAQYLPCMGRRKIERKWKHFMKKNSLCESGDLENEINVFWENSVFCNQKVAK